MFPSTFLPILPWLSAKNKQGNKIRHSLQIAANRVWHLSCKNSPVSLHSCYFKHWQSVFAPRILNQAIAVSVCITQVRCLCSTNTEAGYSFYLAISVCMHKSGIFYSIMVCISLTMKLPLQEVCCRYWPESGNSSQYGEFVVGAIEQMVHEGYTERLLGVTDSKVRAFL